MIHSSQHNRALGWATLCAVFGLLSMQGAAQAQVTTPVINQILPDSLPQGPEFTLTILGDQFDPNAIVQWNGSNLDTSCLSPGVLQATVPASYIVSPDYVTISVINSDGGMSNATDPGAPVTSGWARVDSNSNMLTGVATFQTTEHDVLTSMAGVLAAEPAHQVTIPIDNDAGSGRRTGFAIANSSSDSMNVQIVVLDENGYVINAVNPPQLNSLGPGRQVAKFLDEYLPGLATFKGSVELISLGADQFVSTALQLTPGLTGLGLMTVM